MDRVRHDFFHCHQILFCRPVKIEVVNDRRIHWSKPKRGINRECIRRRTTTTHQRKCEKWYKTNRSLPRSLCRNCFLNLLFNRFRHFVDGWIDLGFVFVQKRTHTISIQNTGQLDMRRSNNSNINIGNETANQHHNLHNVIHYISTTNSSKSLLQFGEHGDNRFNNTKETKDNPVYKPENNDKTRQTYHFVSSSRSFELMATREK